MERTRRGLEETTAGRNRRTPAPARQSRSLSDEILDLQSTAGNRSVASVIGDAAVQRDAKPAAARNDGGVLTFDSGEVIPLQTVTWSATQKIARDTEGQSRFPTSTIPTRLEFGDLEITRLRDANSPRADEILDAKVHDHATLTLNQASADGGLPAEKFELQQVGIKEIKRARETGETKGEDLTEQISVYVGHLSIAGQVKDDSKATKAQAVAYLDVHGGHRTPVLAWEPSPVKGRKTDVDEGSLGRRVVVVDPLFTVTLQIPAGEGLNGLAAMLDGGRHFDATLTPNDGRSVLDVEQALVEEIKSSALGPGVVEVKLVAETNRVHRMP